MEAYCVKCKQKREMTNTEKTFMNSRSGKMRAMKGKCPTCGTGMYRILGKA